MKGSDGIAGGAFRLRRGAWRAGGVALSLALTLLGLLLVTFVIGRLVPIDPALTAVGDKAGAGAYAKAHAALRLDLPLYRQFALYVGGVLHGDLGRSLLTSNPVLTDIARFFPATIELATLSTIFGVALGVPLGVAAAARQGRWQDQLIRVFGLLGYSIPIFWLGLVALFVLYARLGLVAGPGRLGIGYDDIVTPVTGLLVVDSALEGQWAVLLDALRHLVLPAAVLGYFSLAYVSRMVRSLMIDQLRQEYVMTARIKGLSERRVVWCHAFRNVLLPLVTVVALSYANLLEGSVLTETVFDWPGIGSYITNALLNADMNAVLGGTIVVGAAFVTLNMAADFLGRLLDPRARSL